MVSLPSKDCKFCGEVAPRHWPYRCPANPKAKNYRLPKSGKVSREWARFRDQVAKPYLIAKQDSQCALCHRRTMVFDVDHIKNRGSHPELRYDLDNLQLLCRACHRKKTDRLY